MSLATSRHCSDAVGGFDLVHVQHVDPSTLQNYGHHMKTSEAPTSVPEYTDQSRNDIAKR